jgi:hypothetical protein
MRILVAHGNRAVLDSIHADLQGSGHDVVTARDGIECSQALNEFAPDVALLGSDLLWGGYEGIMSKMKRCPVLAKVPVIQLGTRPRDSQRGSLWMPPVVGCLPESLQISRSVNQLLSTRRQFSLIQRFENTEPASLSTLAGTCTRQRKRV